jgi:hypothetical protein
MKTRVSMSVSLDHLRHAISNWKFDILILLAAAMCFGLFIRNSLQFETLSGITSPIGLLRAGKALKRSSGAREFTEATAGIEFFNMLGMEGNHCSRERPGA